MAIKFLNASDQKLLTASNSLSDIGGGSDWAISYKIKLPAIGAYGADNRFIAFNRFSGGPNNGFFMWHQDHTSHGGTRFSWECYDSGSGGNTNFNSSDFDAFNNSGFHDWFMYKSSATEITIYVDGGFIQTMTAAASGLTPGVVTTVSEFGSGVYGNNRAPECSIQDFRLYKDSSMDYSVMAKIIFESQGRDNITDGLLSRWKQDENTTGSTVTAPIDLSVTPNNIITVQNAPTYEAAPYN